MGRRGELSDFQRGTVVGCYMCSKSVREISTLVGLPRSTVSAVILRWKREGATTALPRSGRPHKLKEEHRQVLEEVALGGRLPTVKALTTEFNTASGAQVSVRTVRRELHEMGFRGRVCTYSKPGGEKEEMRQADEGEATVDVSRLDLRVGRIVVAMQLQDNSLHELQVDVGEAAPRTVVSRLAKHVPVDQMQNRMAVLLCNLKPVKVRGVESQAMIMCASSPDKVEILDPPSGAMSGDRVTFQGFPGKPDKELNPQKRVWEQIQPDLRTDSQCVATYKGAAFEVASRGACKARTMSDAQIK
ncbi:aminoacyl tRNA synthase complex-interacting multifunctional protein 1-like [Brachionichthys hirsutus]|uniref:aminoacyl tRNA synthase complex-interacting multifunctional protein 1-like n=1 Tax=Brachionichthys hirsutus TaxID=412623 RepID=UPI0036043797